MEAFGASHMLSGVGRKIQGSVPPTSIKHNVNALIVR